MCGDGRMCVFCCKYVLIVGCCILHVLCGCALVGLGLYLCVEPTMREYAGSSGDLQEYYIALYCLIGIGGLMMLVGFLGCCGACAENRLLLVLFFLLLLLICVAEVGGGFYAYFERDQLQTMVTKSMTDTMLMKYPEDPVKGAVDNMQQQLECCGSTAPVMWCNSTRADQPTGQCTIPASCCRSKVCQLPTTEAAVRAQSKVDLAAFYTEGCSEKLFKLLEENLVLIAGLTIGVGVVQLLGMIFSCCLCVGIGRQEREKEYI